MWNLKKVRFYLSLMAFTCFLLQGMASEKPNILFISVDDMGVDAINGYGVGDDLPSTPNLDKLRESGASIQQKLDDQLQAELSRIGEEDIKAREFYLKKFGYYGREEFRPGYHIRDVADVKKVLTPYSAFEIE
jgi:hypothetical protein